MKVTISCVIAIQAELFTFHFLVYEECFMNVVGSNMVDTSFDMPDMHVISLIPQSSFLLELEVLYVH